MTVPVLAALLVSATALAQTPPASTSSPTPPATTPSGSTSQSGAPLAEPKLRTDADIQREIDARVEAALAVRRQRQARKLSQKQLAGRLKTSQPRVAKIERAAPDVSLDQILRAFAAAGGRITVKQVSGADTRKPSGVERKKAGTASDLQTAEVQIELMGSES